MFDNASFKNSYYVTIVQFDKILDDKNDLFRTRYDLLTQAKHSHSKASIRENGD